MTANFRTVKLQAGVSLIELMVALVLGLFLIFGAVTIYQQSRSTFRTTEAVARLQEAARLAFDVLEADVRMASYWGLNNKADYIVNRAGPGDPLPAEFTTLQEPRISACGGTGSNWAINLDEYIGGADNSYNLDPDDCGSFEAAPTTGDLLVIRRASDAIPTTLRTDRIYIQSSRVQGTLFVPASACNPINDAGCIPSSYLPPASTTRELRAHAYYVSTESTMRDDVPSLRRKTFSDLDAATASGAVTDEEIVPGVEDMQIRFGISNDLDPDIDAYRDPGAVLATDEIVSVTIWLRVRSEEPEFGHVDGNSYQYANMGAAFEPGDNYRRIVVSKTIQLRNKRS